MYIKKILLSAATIAGVLTAGTLAANADTITVQSGQTVSEIAREHNTSVAQIKQANNLQNENLIFVGQKIEVGTATSTTTTAAPAQQAAQTTQQQAPAASTQQTTQQKAPVASTQQTTQQQAPAAQTNNNSASTQQTASVSTVSGSDQDAQSWIASKESGGSYSARNGQYVGKYQLSASYLNGDYSAANQERVAQNYVSSRYGSWSAAKQHWLSNGWY
ncbi:LysM peptidoglycan-binding domain-containing protein [Liquorilactobacillus oeni]|nr:LysM domain-containing protein [Liquorilactobacillus oeni]